MEIEIEWRRTAKIKRNCRMAGEVLDGKTIRSVAKKNNVSDSCLEQILVHLFRKILFQEENRVQYLSAKVMAIQYKERLEQILFRDEQQGEGLAIRDQQQSRSKTN